MFPLNITGEVDHVLPLTGVRSAVALDWDGASKRLFKQTSFFFFTRLSLPPFLC